MADPPPCAHLDPQPLADAARRCRCGLFGFVTTNRLLATGIPVGLSGVYDNLAIRRTDDSGQPLG